MTQYSYFHDGSYKGDAQHAPYADSRFHEVMDVLYGGGGFILSTNSISYWDFNVIHNAAQTVTVDNGVALIKGVLFYSDADVDITLEANTSGLPRLDAIVIRINWNTASAELGYVKGTPAAVPAMPTLQLEVGNIYEQIIATCYIPDSFTGFDDTLIYDDRIFIKKYDQDKMADISYYKNVMHNSTMAFDGAMWFGTDPSPNYDSLYKYPSNTFSLGAAGTIHTKQLVSKITQSTVTISFEITVSSGSVDFSIDDGATTLKTYYPEASPRRVYVRAFGTFDGSAYVAQIKFTATSANTEIELSPVTMGLGPYKGSSPNYVTSLAKPPLANHEIILFDNPITGAGGSIGAVTDSLVLSGIAEDPHALLVRLEYYNSSAAFDDVWMRLHPNVDVNEDFLRVEVGRLTNSTRRQAVGWIHPIAGGTWIIYGDTARANGTYSIALLGAVI